MKKLLTISIAAYNVENFIENTLNSLTISESDELEVLIINDGSKDKTLEIAEAYEKKYPNIFKAINKPNGGYGSTINKGIDLASGKYFKQLDGDDWYDTENLKKILNTLKDVDEDVIYTPYIAFFEKNESREIVHNKIEQYKEERFIKNVINFSEPYLPMHSLMFKTQILKENNIRILEHCFYTDVEYSVYPFLYAQTIRILETPLYVYRIGREGQSVSIEGKLKHYQDHLRVDEKMLELLKSEKELNNNVYDYLKDYFSSIFASCIANYLLILKPTRENYQLIRDYDHKVLETNEEVYKKMSQKSGAVKSLRKSGFLKYKFLHWIKLFKEKMKG